MVRVLCLAAAFAALAACVAKPPTYDEALARQTELARDPQVRAWTEEAMPPFWNANAQAVFKPCLQADSEGATKTVRMVVEVRGNKTRPILEDPATTFARCVARNMGELVWPEYPPQLKYFPLALQVTVPGSVISLLWATGPDAGNVRRVHFTCDNGEELQVVFFRTLQIADLVRNQKGTELSKQPSGSGFHYSNGTHTIRGKGEDLAIEVTQQPTLNCKAK
jgi:membrane-bound inhibitor of C-type lysozyme